MIYGKLFAYGSTNVVNNYTCEDNFEIILGRKKKGEKLYKITKKRRTTRIKKSDEMVDIYRIGCHNSNDIVIDAEWYEELDFLAQIVCNRETGICKLYYNDKRDINTDTELPEINIAYLDEKSDWHDLSSDGTMSIDSETGKSKKRKRTNTKESILKDNTLIDLSENIIFIWKEGDYEFDQEKIFDLKDSWLEKKTKEGIMCPVSFYRLTITTKLNKYQGKRLYRGCILDCGHVFCKKYYEFFNEKCPLCMNKIDEPDVLYKVNPLDCVTEEQNVDDYDNSYILKCGHMISSKQNDIIDKYNFPSFIWNDRPICPQCGDDIMSKSKLYLHELIHD
jgi:hypothetical protein